MPAPRAPVSLSFRTLLLALGFVCVCMQAAQAGASVADVREVARLNNCNPKKIEVMSQDLGGDSQTLYRVACIMPKMAGDAASGGADALVIQCDGMLCALVRPLGKDEK